MKQTKNSEIESAGTAAKAAKPKKAKPIRLSQVEASQAKELDSPADSPAEAPIEAAASEAETAETPVEDVRPEAEAVASEGDDAGSAAEKEAPGPDEAVTQAEETAAQDESAVAAPESAEPAVEAGPPKQWFVVHTYSGHENKVKANLERAIASQAMQANFAQVLVATEDFAEMKDGKKTITKRKTFPSYVLIEMDMSNETRHLVTNIPGVTGFVGTGRDPIPLRVEEVRRVLGLDAEGKVAKPTPSVPFKIGEHVRVVDGPFSDFTGVVDEVNSERGKVKVMVSIFGRATPVELDFLQVQSI